MSLLELDNVSYQYPNAEANAVDSFSGTLETGKLTALLGCNGSGKSTIAKLAAGLTHPDSGTVLLNKNFLSAGWNGIGYLFQYPDDQFITASIESELAYGLENLALPPDQIVLEVKKALHQFHLLHLKDRSPEQLSDGQKQLVALVSVLLMHPKFLVLDEALSYLDLAWQQRIWQIISEINPKTGILWITTRTAEALRADEVWLINTGRMVNSGSPSKVLSNSNLEYYGLEPL